MTYPSVIGIAGAGLAGLTTAIGLAQSDRPVEVFEAAPDSGWWRKGTWDAIENWTTEDDFMILLDRWKISHSFECRPISNFEVYDLHGECHSITTPRPTLYLVKRGNQSGALEYSLKNQALEYGVTIHYNQQRNYQDVDVWAVGAQHKGQFLGAGIQFKTRHPDTVKLLISSNHAPKAYAYLFIVDGQGLLSVTLTRNHANARIYLQRSLEFFRKVSPLNLDMDHVRLSSGFGGRWTDFWQSESTALRVGEAAGLQDYLWGFGIRYALHSGYLAAQALDQGFDYNQAIRTQIHPLVHTSFINRAVYNQADDNVYRLLIGWFSRSPKLIELLRRRYSASIPKQLLWLLRSAQRNQLVQGRYG
jgi:flavin-dependent dehydrogenase